MPAPLVPAEVDLRDFGFMPLDVLRLRDSDLATDATGDEFKAAVLLWCTSWHQQPPASLPNRDAFLVKHSGAGSLAAWRKVKEMALRGFVECSDGRLYHGVIAEKAVEAWTAKQAQRARTKAATEAREAKRLATPPPSDGGRLDARHDPRHDPRDGHRRVQRNVERDVHQGTGTGTGTVKGQGQGIPPTVEAASKSPRPAKKAPAKFAVTDAMRAWAKESTPLVLVDAETDSFRDHTFSRAITDWPGAWRNWMRKAQGFAETRTKRPSGLRPTFGERATAEKSARLAEMTGGLLGTAQTSAQQETIDMEAHDGAPRLMA